VVDQQAQARMPFGDPANGRKLVRRHQRNRDLDAFGGGPQPVHRAVAEPVLLVRLEKEKAQPEHARPALPAVDQRPALRLVQREMVQDRKPIRLLAGGLDRDLDIVAVLSGRMEYAASTPPSSISFRQSSAL
jgi:hypothetical protein